MKHSAPGNPRLMLAALCCSFILAGIGFLEGAEHSGPVTKQTSLSVYNDLRGPIAPPQHKVNLNRLLKAVQFVESHGDIHAISGKGAKGLYQIMPDTARKPGMGVKPLRGWSAREQRRFAHDYLGALIQRFHGNTKKALAAYNFGARYLESASAKLPPETVHYVEKVQHQYALLDYSGIEQ